MAGYGSGSWQVARRPLAERCAKRQVRDLGRTQTRLDSDGRKTVMEIVDPDGRRTVLQSIRIERTPQPAGGWRRRFRCPQCNRRCEGLFQPRSFDEVRCRLCHRVADRSQRVTESDRLLQRAPGGLMCSKRADVIRPVLNAFRVPETPVNRNAPSSRNTRNRPRKNREC